MATQTSFFRWRLTLALITAINVALMAAYYGVLATSSSNMGFGAPDLVWSDWAEISLCVILFFSYCFSLFGVAFLNRFLRVFLLTALTGLLLYVNFSTVHNELLQPGYNSYYIAFACYGETLCYLMWATTFGSIIQGFLVIIDVGISPKLGPLEPWRFTSSIQKSQPTEVVIPSAQFQGYSQPAYFAPQVYHAQQPGNIQQQPYSQQPPFSVQPTQMQSDGSYKLENQGYHPGQQQYGHQ